MKLSNYISPPRTPGGTQTSFNHHSRRICNRDAGTGISSPVCLPPNLSRVTTWPLASPAGLCCVYCSPSRRKAGWRLKWKTLSSALITISELPLSKALIPYYVWNFINVSTMLAHSVFSGSMKVEGSNGCNSCLACVLLWHNCVANRIWFFFLHRNVCTRWRMAVTGSVLQMQ